MKPLLEFFTRCYGYAIDSIVDYPQTTFWSGLVLIVVATLVF